ALRRARGWLAVARDCFADDYGSLACGLLTSVFAPVIGLKRLFHLDQMEDRGFAVLSGGRTCPTRHTVGGWRRHLRWYEVDAFCRRTSPWEWVRGDDALVSFDEHTLPRWTRKYALRKGYVTTRNKYMRCEKLFYGYHVELERYLCVQAATVHSPAGENCVNSLATAKGFSQIGGHAAGDQPRTDCPTASGSPSHHSDVAGEDPGVGSASEPVPSEFFAAAEYRTSPRQAPETQVPNETQAGWSTVPPQTRATPSAQRRVRRPDPGETSGMPGLRHEAVGRRARAAALSGVGIARDQAAGDRVPGAAADMSVLRRDEVCGPAA